MILREGTTVLIRLINEPPIPLTVGTIKESAFPSEFSGRNVALQT